MQNGWAQAKMNAGSQRESYCKRHQRDDGGLAWWWVEKMVRTQVLEVDFQNRKKKQKQDLVEVGWKGEGEKDLRNDPMLSAGATRWIKCQFLLWDTSLPSCHVFVMPYQAQTETCMNLTRSSKKNQAYLKTVSLTIPVLTTICRASSSWKCWMTNTQRNITFL